jgi:hypothetical protein
MSLQLNGTDGVTFNDGSEQWAAASPIGTKNLIINGDMRIWQRGTSALAKTSNSYLADRFFNNLGNLNGSAYNMTQDSDVPTGQGFPYSIKLQPSTALSSPVSNTFVSIVQNLESLNVNHLAYGTANAKTITLSFWIKSNITGIVPAGIFQNGTNAGTARSYPFTYNIDEADTWEKKTIVITGDSNGSLPIANNVGFELNLFYMAIGSDFQNGTENSWNANSAGTEYIASGHTFINRANSTSNYIKVTGVQLEVGDTATPFEHRPYDMELARCQRYYVKYTAAGGGTGYTYANAQNGGSGWQTVFYLPQTMRTTPSLSSSGTFSFHINGVSTRNVSSVSINSTVTGGNVVRVTGGKTSGDTTGLMGQIIQRSGSSGYIDFSAEL